MASLGTLHVSWLDGEELQIELALTATVRALKEKLTEAAGKQASNMTLMQDVEILQDDWILMEHGVNDGTRLSLVLSRPPCGTFELRPDTCPAGQYTEASVYAVFDELGNAEVTVDEKEFTNDEGPHHNPYVSRVNWLGHWHHKYHGTASFGQDSKFSVSVSDCTRKGDFSNVHAQELNVEFCNTDSHIMLQIPFAAGGRNGDTAGLRWVTLERTSATPFAARILPAVRHCGWLVQGKEPV